MEINWNQIETKWQSKWNESKDFETNPNEKPKKIHHRSLSISKLTETKGTWENIHIS
jgi:leucyl-tRNA synthetase